MCTAKQKGDLLIRDETKEEKERKKERERRRERERERDSMCVREYMTE